MINSFIPHFLNIASTGLKLLYLALYLIYKGKLVLCFGSIIFLKSRFAGYDFISISIYSHIWIRRWYCINRFRFYLDIFQRFLILWIVIIIFCHVIISDLIIIFNNFIVSTFTSFSNFFYIVIIIVAWYALFRFFVFSWWWARW